MALGIAALSLAAESHAHGARRPLAKTQSGWVRGLASDGVERFLSIPFAAPPLGALRFRPAAPVAPWRGIREADTLSPICVQDFVDGVEDCLYLNVYRPARPRERGPLPVMVWIHGGSLIYGSGAQYDPSELADLTDTIVVTINYRLNVFGFLGLPGLSAEADDGISGNYGFTDQLAALRWVQRNIAAFGGAPDEVTLAGQSAGGFSICALLASPQASELFSGAIIQSGGCLSVTREEAERRGAAFAEAVGCTDPGTAPSCLRDKSEDELLAAGANHPSAFVTGGELLPRDPRQAIADGDFTRVPVLLGSAVDEVLVGLGGEYPMPEESYEAALASVFADLTPLALAEYPAADYADPVYAFSAAVNDSGLALIGSCAIRGLARDLAEHVPTYYYEFDDPDAPPPSWAFVPEGFDLGSSHSAELAYLFEPSTLVNEPLTRAQQRLGRQMLRYWGSFVARGNPSTWGQPRWPRFQLDDERMLRLRPDAIRQTRDFSERHHCDFWASLLSASPTP